MENPPARILLVEDDVNLATGLARYLRDEGFAVDVAASLAEARARTAVRPTPALVVLDWMLPDGQGLDYLRELDRAQPALPVILLTARAELVDRVLGLESGARDYVTKPFEPRELAARIRVQLRQSVRPPARPAESVREFCGIRLDPATRKVTYHGRSVELAKLEFELLRALIDCPGRVFPREALLNQVWGYENYPTTRTVDNHIVLLRQKLAPGLIETVRGVGYRLRES